MIKMINFLLCLQKFISVSYILHSIFPILLFLFWIISNFISTKFTLLICDIIFGKELFFEKEIARREEIIIHPRQSWSHCYKTDAYALSPVKIRRISRLRENGSTIDLIRDATRREWTIRRFMRAGVLEYLRHEEQVLE